MYQEHSAFVEPENQNVKVWRYLDFTKFISMLDSSSLYFTRSDFFEDPFEGATTDSVIKKRTLLYKAFNSEEEASEKIAHESNMQRNLRLQYAMNCWHENENESAAMWKLYLQTNEGVAICSTFLQLKRAFDFCDFNVNLGRVRYIDYKTEDFTNGMLGSHSHFVHKRKSFEHEREIRAVIWIPGEVDFDALMEKDGRKPKETIKHGLLVPVNIQELINTVYIAPNAADWFLEIVKKMTLRFGYTIDVVQSNLYNGPVF